jgi:hypothetical protein
MSEIAEVSTNETAIERVCKIAGGQVAIAKARGVTPQAVSQWVKKGRVPADHVIGLESLVGGQVTRHELRPDVFGGVA